MNILLKAHRHDCSKMKDIPAAKNKRSNEQMQLDGEIPKQMEL